MFFYKKYSNSTDNNNQNRALKGFSIIELLVSSMIVGVVVSTVFGLIAAQTRQMNANKKVSESLVHLREISALLTRELETVASGTERAGHFVSFTDGGGSAADRLIMFRVDAAFLKIPLSVTSHSSVTQILDVLTVDDDGDPLTPEICSFSSAVEDALSRGVVGLRGANRSGFFRVSNADTASCTISVTTADNGDYLSFYNRIHGSSFSSMQQVLGTSAGSLGAIQGVEIGYSTEYWVENESDLTQSRLMRSVNGLPDEVVLKGVLDLQVQFAHDLGANPDGIIDAAEWDMTGTLTGATTTNFKAVKVGFTTVSKSHDGLKVTVPTNLGNRIYGTLNDENRYRSSFVVIASRNSI